MLHATMKCEDIDIHNIIVVKAINFICSYSVMKKCWEASPKDRPSFTEIYEELSHFIERVAGYLDIKFNPFLADERGKDTTGKDIETQ